MFPLKRLSHLSNGKPKRRPVFLATRRQIAGAVAIGGAAILVLGSAAPTLFSNRQRPPDSPNSVPQTDTGYAQSLDAVVTEPKTSAIQLVPLPSELKERPR